MQSAEFMEESQKKSEEIQQVAKLHAATNMSLAVHYYDAKYDHSDERGQA